MYERDYALGLMGHEEFRHVEDQVGFARKRIARYFIESIIGYTHPSIDAEYIKKDLIHKIQTLIQDAKFDFDEYGFIINDRLYQRLVYEFSYQDTSLTPENFEQRTTLDINTYPVLMKMFSSLDYDQINSNEQGMIRSRTLYDGISISDYYKRTISGPDLWGQTTNNYGWAVQKNYSLGYIKRYNKRDISNALVKLGFAPMTDIDPNLKTITLADIKPTDKITEIDRQIRLAGFNNHNIYQYANDRLSRNGEKTLYYQNRGLTSLKVYYETIYRSLARTSQHLPWDDFINELQLSELIAKNVKASTGKSYDRYPLTIDSGTIRFIAYYDYDIPKEIIDNSSTLEVCKLIKFRIDLLKSEYTKDLAANLQKEQQQFLGGIIPKSEYLSRIQNIDEYLIHYQDVLKLCQDINTTHEENLEHRSELFRYLELFDLRDIFKKPLETYNNKQICSALSKYLRSLFEERRQGGYQINKYL
jgi:hypothetical protein